MIRVDKINSEVQKLQKQIQNLREVCGQEGHDFEESVSTKLEMVGYTKKTVEHDEDCTKCLGECWCAPRDIILPSYEQIKTVILCCKKCGAKVKRTEKKFLQ